MLRTIHGEPVRDLANAVVVSSKEAARLQRVRARSYERMRKIYGHAFADMFASDQDKNVSQA